MFNVYRQFLLLDGWNFDPKEYLRFNSVVWEFWFWLLVAAAAALFFLWQPRWLAHLERFFSRLSRRKTAVVIGTGLLVFVLRLGTMPWNPKPIPFIHDEFSYLLQEKTFAEGRLTNPTHPMWTHFEGFHINMRPTYQSMYPVGQASFLLVGHLLFGDPWFGVLLGVAFLCSALVWMLQGWMPPPWALFGGILAVFRFGIYGDWVNSYWGGAVAAGGGCLILGAIPRLRHQQHVLRNVVLFSIGLALLANTRAFEGFVFSLVPLGWAFIWFCRQWMQDRTRALKVLASFLLVMLPVFSFMLYYNYRSTGNPLLMAYQINHRTYHISKPFIWQTRYDIPEYRHFIMRKFYVFHELPDYLNSRQPGGIWKLTQGKIHHYYEFFLWPCASGFLFAAWFAAKSRRWRLVFFTGVATVLALLVQMWPPHGHYAAPLTGIVVAFTVLTFRLLRTLHFRGRPIGIAISRGLFATWMIAVGVWYYGNAIHIESLPPYSLKVPPDIERYRISQKLSALPGKHLVIMRNHWYSWAGFDWVYNEPNIDAAKIVWARDLGSLANQELLDYFSGHHVWEIDMDDHILRPYAPIRMDPAPVIARYEGPAQAASWEKLASGIGPR